MKLKQITILIALLIVFVSCSPQDNKGNIMSVNETNKVSISQIWDGYEELQGQDYGVIKLPEKITVQPTDGLCKLTLTPVACEDEQEASKRFFKAFFGKDYDDSKCTTLSDTGDSMYDDPEIGNAVFTHGGGNRYAMPITAFRNGENTGAAYEELLGIFDPVNDKDCAVELPDGIFTISELCDSAERFIQEGLYPLYGTGGLVIKPYELIFTKSKDDPQNRVMQVLFSFGYKGIDLQEKSSPFNEARTLKGYNTQTYYAVFNITLDMKGTDRFTSYSNNSLPYRPECEAMTELISLGDAVGLLRSELAPNSRYEFTNIVMKYCHKQTTASDAALSDEERIKASYELSEFNDSIAPTWCFEWTGSNDITTATCAIKVNAVTGEITIDSDPSLKAVNSENKKVTAAAPVTPKETRTGKITVDVISYDGETLKYSYDGKEESIAVPLSTFGAYIPGLQHLASEIINNKFGIKVKCILDFDKNGNVTDADVKTPNGKTIDGFFGAQPPKEWEKEHYGCWFEEVSARRVSGSIYEVSNERGTVRIDLNDLSYKLKANYPDEIPRAVFHAFQFTSGETILEGINGFCIVIPDSEAPSGAKAESSDISALPMFAGTVQSLTEDRAEVLLTDGKTLCDVPTYYNDGEIKEGMDVMLTLDANISLYGSGEQYKADYAVFTTHPEAFVEGYKKEDHAKYAYALRDEHNSVVYHGVMRDEALTQ